jgi:hypothetical protein
MTLPSTSTKSRRPRSVKARARRLAEILAECSAGIVPGDYSEAAISAFAADLAAELRQFPPHTPKPCQSISKMIEQAEKATGKPVTSITAPDGMRFDFSKPPDATADDEVENWLRKQQKPKGH